MKFQCLRCLWGGLIFLFSCSTNTAPTNPVDQAIHADSSKSQVIPGQMYRSKENTTTGTIYITVDENLMPIIEAEIDNFETLYPRAKIHAMYLPGEEAIQRMLIADTIRMAIATRQLSDEETDVLRQQHNRPKYAAIAYEGIALVVHPDNPIRKLEYEQLIGILNGSISSWKQVDPTSSLDQISLVFDHAQSSTLTYLQDSILKDQAMTRTSVYAQSNTPEVLTYVATNPGAIGFGGWAWISDVDDNKGQDLKSGVKLLWLGKGEDSTQCAFDQAYFGPYQSYLLQKCYPLTRTMSTVMRESFIGLGTGFVAHLDGQEGQRLIHKSGLVSVHPIPRRVKLPRAANSQQIKEKYWEKESKSVSKE